MFSFFKRNKKAKDKWACPCNEQDYGYPRFESYSYNSRIGWHTHCKTCFHSVYLADTKQKALIIMLNRTNKNSEV